MNKMAEVAKLFDKELEEKFTIIDDNGVAMDAYFNENGVACFHPNSGTPLVSANVLKRLLTGIYRIKETPWKAKNHEKYFVPLLRGGTYEKFYFTVDSVDDIIYQHGLMCKTPKQAEELAQLFIKTARQFQGFDDEEGVWEK